MQISDELIKHITNELMKRLSGKATSKPLLHLVGSREHLSTVCLSQIQECFEIYEHCSWEDQLPASASVLITSLSLQALTRVASGDEGCTVEGRALLAALLNGQPVAALKDGLMWRRYMSTAPKGLLNRYAHYETILQGYGLKLVDESEVTAALLGNRSEKWPLSAPQETLGRIGYSGPEPSAAKPQRGRRVISEADIIAECPVAKGLGQTLCLGSDDILTPLARDYALTMKIDLIKG